MDKFEKAKADALKDTAYQADEFITFDDTEAELMVLARRVADSELSNFLEMQSLLLDIKAVMRVHDVIADYERGDLDG